MSRRRLAAAALAVGVALTGGIGLGMAAVQGARAQQRDPYAGLDMLAEALHAIEQRHVAPPPTEALLQGAVAGMAERLDAHSAYLTPEQRAEFQDRAEGGDTGIGVRLRLDADRVVLGQVTPAGPADLAGALPGDALLAIDGAPVTRLAAAEQALRGPRDTPVTLRVERDGIPQDLHVVRDTILERSVRADRLRGGVAHAQIDAFRRRTGHELREAFDQLESEAPLSGAVLDLRGNAGGLLEEAVSVVDLFLGAGAILEVRGRGGRVLERHTAREEPDDRDLPLVVLVDEESASAAEIVAGALQDRERALVVGTQTYGKGSVQKLFLFEDGGGLKLTVARYHLPSGRSIADGEGLQPDRPVAAPTVRSEAADAFRAALAAADLPDSERAALLTSFDALAETRGAKRPPGSALPPAARVAADPQLAAAHAWLLDQ